MLETHKLQKKRPAKNAQYYRIELNWNVSGTRDFLLSSEMRFAFVSELPPIWELGGSANTTALWEYIVGPGS